VKNITYFCMTNMQISIWFGWKAGQNFSTCCFQVFVKKRPCITTSQNTAITKRHLSMHLKSIYNQDMLQRQVKEQSWTSNLWHQGNFSVESLARTIYQPERFNKKHSYVMPRASRALELTPFTLKDSFIWFTARTKTVKCNLILNKRKYLEIFHWVRKYWIWINIFFRWLFRSGNRCFILCKHVSRIVKQ